MIVSRIGDFHSLYTFNFVGFFMRHSQSDVLIIVPSFLARNQDTNQSIMDLNV